MMRRFIVFGFFFLLVYCSSAVLANDQKNEDQPLTEEQKQEQSEQLEKGQASLKMLRSIIELKKNLNQRIKEKNLLLKKSSSDTEKELLKSELEKLDKQLNDSTVDFERIATGIDMGLFDEKKAEAFDWKDELLGLVKPGIKELKRLTVRARYKTKLKDELSYYEGLLPVATQATENIGKLISQTKNKELKKDLKKILPEWKSVEKQILNKVEIAGMRLDEIEGEEKSIIQTSQTSIKNFFRTRGLFLFIAIVSCLGVILFWRLLSKIMVRVVPGYTSKYRPFHIRVASLLSRILAFVMVFLVLISVSKSRTSTPSVVGICTRIAMQSF